MQSTEERLAQCFRAVAEQTTAQPDWSRVVADSEDRSESSGPSKVLAVAAGLALVVAGAFALVSRSDQTTVDAVDSSRFVLPGETLLSTAPLVVTPAPAPQALFDTGGLGEETFVAGSPPFDDEVTSLIARTTGQSPDRTITKITLLGSVDGRTFFSVVTDGPSGSSEQPGNLRERWVIGPDGGSAEGDFVDPRSTDLIGYGEPVASGPAYGTPVGDVVWAVRGETAIVTFESDDTRTWMRPTGGYAIFPSEFDTGEQFTLQALDIDGNVIDQTSVTTTDDTDPSVGPQVRDRFDSIEAATLDGTQLQIDPDGNPTVLLYGADWCAPCQEIADQAPPLIDSLAPNVEVFIVPTYTEPGETWNLGTGWDQPQITITTDLGGIQAVPTIIVLDGDNTIVAVGIGPDGVTETFDEIERLTTD